MPTETKERQLHYETQIALASQLARANKRLGSAILAVEMACKKDPADLRSFAASIDAANEAYNPKPINELALRLDRSVMTWKDDAATNQ